MIDRVSKYLRWLVGVTFLIAGVAKFLPWPEDPYATLAAGHTANLDSWVAMFSSFTTTHASWLIPSIGAVMVVSGLAQLSGRWVRLASIVQIGLMICFIALLHRSFPSVVIVDGAIAVAITIILWREARRTAHRKY